MSDFAPPISDLLKTSLGNEVGTTLAPGQGRAFALDATAAIPSSLIASSFMFGDGSDGNVTVTTTIALARDMYYNNLTIKSGGVIVPHGFRIYVLDTLSIDSGCAIHRDGIHATNSIPDDLSLYTLYGGSFFDASGSGAGLGAGSGGGSSYTNNAGGPQSGGPGTSLLRTMGGTGGTGGNANDGSGKTGGAAGTLFPAKQSPRYAQVLLGFSPEGNVNGGSGGGGGCEGTGQSAGIFVTNGQGGVGGGVVAVAASSLVNNGRISAVGSAGSERSTDTTVTGGVAAGGAGGGGGGCIFIVYRSYQGGGTVSVAGGAGGAGINGGATGSAGSNGNTFLFKVNS